MLMHLRCACACVCVSVCRMHVQRNAFQMRIHGPLGKKYSTHTDTKRTCTLANHLAMLAFKHTVYIIIFTTEFSFAKRPPKTIL